MLDISGNEIVNALGCIEVEAEDELRLAEQLVAEVGIFAVDYYFFNIGEEAERAWRHIGGYDVHILAECVEQVVQTERGSDGITIGRYMASYHNVVAFVQKLVKFHNGLLFYYLTKHFLLY